MSDTAQPFRPFLGATPHGQATTFRVRAPHAERVTLVLPRERAPLSDDQAVVHPLARHDDGLWTLTVDGAAAGTRYGFGVDGRGPFPDPASRWQPDGVHGPSVVVDWTSFQWSDAEWRGVPLERTVLYELHVGAFTPDGTFGAATERLVDLADLGVTAVELMPLADFPGERNWGYDGVAPFAPARAYGAPDDLRRFVDRAHACGLAVYVDVVYNHLGPDGAYQAMFNPYFYSTTHENPWGAGINFDGPHAEHVREYFIENALGWVHEYHIDGLRLDATHAITDHSRIHIAAELTERLKASVSGPAQGPSLQAARTAVGASPSGRPDPGFSDRVVLVIAEDERNLNIIVRPREQGGWGLDGVWADDLHHQIRVTLAGDRDGYFADYDGGMGAIAATARQGWFYTGQHAGHRGGPRGTTPEGIPLSRAIVCLQNHDQIGNRALGERLHHQISPAAWRAASALLLALPETPLLFMGQEWAASSPFLYFTDHHDELGRLVTAGRRREFGRFAAFADPGMQATIPDPQAETTFTRSTLDWSERVREPHAATLALYRRLLALRRDARAMADIRGFIIAAAGADGLLVRRGEEEGALLFVIRLTGAGAITLDGEAATAPAGCVWQTLFTTEDEEFGGVARASLERSPGTSVPGAAAGAGAPTITFHRPGAVILTAVRATGVPQ